MTPVEFAKMLSGREYGNEITKEEEHLAEKHGLVVCFPYSDDNLELVGAINDEISAYEGVTIYLNDKGLSKKKTPYKIKQEWCKTENIAWTYQTTIPAAKFLIYEDGETWAEGLVFKLSDLK